MYNEELMNFDTFDYVYTGADEFERRRQKRLLSLPGSCGH
jgi:hypothetical protein